MLGKIRFGLQDAKGQDLGSINAENWRAWNLSIQDTFSASAYSPNTGSSAARTLSRG